MKRDRPVASGSTIEGGGAILISPSCGQETGSGTVQRYALLVRTNQTGALHGLLVAGVKNLRSSDEIRLARDRAAAQTGYDPLHQYSLAGVDLREFVDLCVFDNTSVKNDRELLERFGKK